MGQRIPDGDILRRLELLKQQEQESDRQLNQDLIAQERSFQDQLAQAAPVSVGIQQFIDSTQGTNFSKSAEALANQRAIMQTGGAPGLADAADDIKDNQRDQTKLELDILEQRRKEAEQARKQQDQERKDRESEAKIRKDNAQALAAATKGTGTGEKSVREQQREDSFKLREGKSRRQLLSSKFTAPVRKKVDEDILKFKTVTATWRDALKTGEIASIRSAISAFAKGFQGESGVLTDTDIGRQFISTIPDRIKNMKEILLGPELDNRATLNDAERGRLARVVSAEISGRRDASEAFVQQRAKDTKIAARIGAPGDRELLEVGDNGFDVIDELANEKIAFIRGSLQDLDLSTFENFQGSGGGSISEKRATLKRLKAQRQGR